MPVELPPNATMRDIHDVCVRNGMPSLAQGMIELPPPQRLRELAAEIIVSEATSNVHTYRNRWGELEYREAIQSLLKKQFDCDVAIESILGTQGVTSGIVATMLHLRNSGVRRIGLVTPFYTYHLKDIETVFGPDSTCYIRTNEDFSLDFAKVEEALVSGGIGAILITNPGNPTCYVQPKEDLDRLVELAAKHNNCHVIIDECYCDMIYTPAGFYSPIQSGLRDNVTVCRGFSKCLGVQSWRMGYLVSTPKNVTAAMQMHDPVYISVPMLQHAMAAYLSKHYEEYATHSKQTAALIERNWKVLSPAFKQALGWIPQPSQGSMYGLFRYEGGDDMSQTVRALELKVGVCPGTIFMPGGENSGFVRIHCGVAAEKADKIVAMLTSSSST